FSKPAIRVTLLASALLASTLALPAHAATVTLNNGDRLTGELIQLGDQILVFRSGLVGEINIPWEHVETLISDEGVRIQLEDGTEVQGKIVLEPGDDLIIQPEDGAPAHEVPRVELTALNPP